MMIGEEVVRASYGMNGVANVSLCHIFCSVVLSYEGETNLFIKIYNNALATTWKPEARTDVSSCSHVIT